MVYYLPYNRYLRPKSGKGTDIEDIADNSSYNRPNANSSAPNEWRVLLLLKPYDRPLPPLRLLRRTRGRSWRREGRSYLGALSSFHSLRLGAGTERASSSRRMCPARIASPPIRLQAPCPCRLPSGAATMPRTGYGTPFHVADMTGPERGCQVCELPRPRINGLVRARSPFPDAEHVVRERTNRRARMRRALACASDRSSMGCPEISSIPRPPQLWACSISFT